MPYQSFRDTCEQRYVVHLRTGKGGTIISVTINQKLGIYYNVITLFISLIFALLVKEASSTLCHSLSSNAKTVHRDIKRVI